MINSRIVTPQEAQAVLDSCTGVLMEPLERYAHTVATEPDRTRAAVVEALRNVEADLGGLSAAALTVRDLRQAVEYGSNW